MQQPSARRSQPAAALLFWFMFLAGGAALLACVYLPIWLENRELRRALDSYQLRLTRQEERLVALARQSEALQDDPAYFLRQVRQEFGLAAPGPRRIHIEPAEIVVDGESSAVEPPPEAEQVAVAVESAARRDPLLSVFVLPESRPYVMAMSGVLVIVALALLNRSRAAGRG